MDETIIINGVKYRRVEEETETARPRTGYERVAKGKTYYTTDIDNTVIDFTEENDASDNTSFDYANYVSDNQLADDNGRADALTRRLRQWQALNDEHVRWSGTCKNKYKIIYNYVLRQITAVGDNFFRDVSVIYFSSKEKAFEAIEVFRDELTWYFTEYRQRLDEPER